MPRAAPVTLPTVDPIASVPIAWALAEPEALPLPDPLAEPVADWPSPLVALFSVPETAPVAPPLALARPERVSTL